MRTHNWHSPYAQTPKAISVRGVLATKTLNQQPNRVAAAASSLVLAAWPQSIYAPTANADELYISSDQDDDIENIPRLDRAMGQGRVDPFDSYPIPTQSFYAALIDHWIIHHTPRIPFLDFAGVNYMRSGYFRHCIQEPALFYELVLFSYCSHAKMSKIQDPSYKATKSWLKNETVQALNQLLLNPLTATSDITILSVAAMASYEFVYGDAREHQGHMLGLQAMAKIRGGITSPTIAPDISRIVTIVDVNQARVTGQPPFLVHKDQNAAPKGIPGPASQATGSNVHTNAATLFSFGHTSSPHPEFGLALRHLNTIILAIDDFDLGPSKDYDRVTVRQECDSLIAALTKLDGKSFLKTSTKDVFASAEARAIECARLAALGTCYRILRHFNEVTVDQDKQEIALILRLQMMEGQELPPRYVSVLLWALFMCGQNATWFDPIINRMVHRACNFLDCITFEDTERVLVTFSYLRAINFKPCAHLWQAAANDANAEFFQQTLEFQTSDGALVSSILAP